MKKSALYASAVVVLAGLFAISGRLRIAIDPTAYHWRNDDGSEITATFIGEEGEPYTAVTAGTPLRLRLGAGNPGTESEFNLQATTSLQSGENSYGSAVIDTAHGYAYYGGSSEVVKVALGAGGDPPRRVGSVPMGNDYGFTSAAVIDTANGYAYFAANNEITKVALGAGDDPPRQIGTISLEGGDYYILAGDIDAANGYAYFSTNTFPAKVVKIALGTGDELPRHVGDLSMDSGEDESHTLLVDAAHGYGYVSIGNYSDKKIIKFALGSGEDLPTRIGDTVLDGTFDPVCGIIDPDHGYAYYGAVDELYKVALGAGDDSPVLIGRVDGDINEGYYFSAVIDAANGYGYFSLDGFYQPRKVLKFELGAGDTMPTRIADVLIPDGIDQTKTAVIDADNGYGYFYAETPVNWDLAKAWDPAKIVKVALGADADPPTRIGALALIPGDLKMNTSVFDTANGYGYFGTGTLPAKIIKVALGAGGDQPVRIGDIILPESYGRLTSAVIDPAAGYAYFGTDTSPGMVVKIALGAGNDLPTVVGDATAGAGQNQFTSAAIDTGTGYAFFGTSTDPATIVKVRLNGAGLPVIASTLTLDVATGYFTSAVIDPANGFVYFGTSASPGNVAKFGENEADTAPYLVGTLGLSAGENALTSAVIDPANGYAYFGTGTAPAKVVKVALGGPADPPARIDAADFATGENVAVSAVIDPANGFAYFGTGAFGCLCPPQFMFTAKAVKFSLGDGDDPPVRVGALPNEWSSYLVNEWAAGLNTAGIDTDNGYLYFGYAYSTVEKVSIAPKLNFRLEYGTKITTCQDIGSWTAVSATPTTEAWQMSDSPNLTDGEPTTNSPGLIDTNVSFKAGLAKDTGADTTTISLGEREFTELEYSIEATLYAPDGEDYCFRLTNAGAPTVFAESLYPQATVYLPAVTPLSYRWRNDNGTEADATFAAPEDIPLTNVHAGTPLRLRLTAGSSANQGELLRKAATTLAEGEDVVFSAVVDTLHGYAYFGTYSVPAVVVKVRLGSGDDPPVRVGAVTLPVGEPSILSAIIDPENGYAYFGSGYGADDKVVKIRLGDGDDPPEYVGSLTLPAEDYYLKTAVIDQANGYGYFATATGVVKVRLGAGDDLPVRVDALSLASFIDSAVIDAANGYAYFGTGAGQGSVFKVRLGAGDDPMTLVGSVLIEGYGTGLWSATIDTVNGAAYFGTVGGDVIKVELGVGDALPTNIGRITLGGELSVAAIDMVNGYAYFGTGGYGWPGIVYKVRLSSNMDTLPIAAGSITLDSGEGGLEAGVIDPVNGYVYFATYGLPPARVVKVSIAPKARFRLEYGPKFNTCQNINSWTAVPVTATTEAWQMSDSPNLTDGEPTTNVAGGLIDPNAVFKPGEAKDVASQTSLISLGEREFTELEYSIEATANANAGGDYCFRLTNAGAPTAFAESLYPQASIYSPPTTGGSPVATPPSVPPQLPPPGGPAAVTPGVTTVTLCFTNEANAPGGYRVYQINPGGTRTLLAETIDPTATCITVPGLTPDTTYPGPIVVVPVGTIGEGPASPEYPPFTTLPVPPGATIEPKVVLTKEVEVFKVALQVPSVGEPASSFPTAGPYVKEGEPPTYTVPDSINNISEPTYDMSRLQGTIDSLLLNPDSDQPLIVDLTQDRAVLRYRVTARNDGLATAYNIDITDRIPDFMAYQPESTVIDNALNTDVIDFDRVVYIKEISTLKVKISELKPGETKFFTFDTVLVTRPTDAIKNKATATYTDVRP